MYVAVPNRRSVKCLDPGLQGIGLGNSVCGGDVRPKPCPALRPQETSSRDPAAMEETCAKVSPTHSTCDTTEASSQQSENIVLNAYTLYYMYIILS
jgi:hypothetical protein